ncbi:hypothetical protein A2Z22_02490 [Candidatus Woesebacteria bacterium RBG_16_34_12]|uniref:Uncharacterized protein n=1 Tax=Candidatus Woesebacteria bacterium RBG_16_34_12 TaxID=1802480 RepID=A0A1F7X9U0_9BACT|nr:MAG: hypothetical protein A2Z22_02490 [Candidatus Woesebacteria bacterium RBG_16_34_12]
MRLQFTTITTIFTLFALMPLSYSQGFWQYPIKPGTEKWNSLTLQERRNCQQIPEEILNQMTPQELFQAWLDLPGKYELLAFNTMQRGFDFTLNTFNIVQELLDKPSVSSVILDYYLNIDINTINKKNNDEKSKFTTDIGFVEFLLSQLNILNGIQEKEKINLLKKIESNYQTKIAYGRFKYRYMGCGGATPQPAETFFKFFKLRFLFLLII